MSDEMKWALKGTTYFVLFFGGISLTAWACTTWGPIGFIGLVPTVFATLLFIAKTA